MASAESTEARLITQPTERSMPARDDDEGLAEPEQQDRRDRDEDVLRIAEREEEVDRAAVVTEHRDDEEGDQQPQERPTPRAG